MLSRLRRLWRRFRHGAGYDPSLPVGTFYMAPVQSGPFLVPDPDPNPTTFPEGWTRLGYTEDGTR